MAEPNRVLEHVRVSGATVVLQALQFIDPAHAQLSTNLALELDQPIQVNAYLSPFGRAGLDIHFDFHDVFTVQLAGTSGGTSGPTRPQRTSRQARPGSGSAEDLTSWARRWSIGSSTGRLPRHPRGFPHAAETTDYESAHLTIGVMAVTWDGS